MIDRVEVKRRVYAAIQSGYATHRIMNKILNEMAAEIVDALADELEKDNKHGSNEAETNAVRKGRKETSNEGTRATAA